MVTVPFCTGTAGVMEVSETTAGYIELVADACSTVPEAAFAGAGVMAVGAMLSSAASAAGASPVPPIRVTEDASSTTAARRSCPTAPKRLRRPLRPLPRLLYCAASPTRPRRSFVTCAASARTSLCSTSGALPPARALWHGNDVGWERMQPGAPGWTRGRPVVRACRGSHRQTLSGRGGCSAPRRLVCRAERQ